MTLILCCWFQWLSKLFTEIRYFIGWFSWVNKCKMFTFGLDKQTNRISKWDIYLGALFRRLEKKKKKPLLIALHISNAYHGTVTGVHGRRVCWILWYLCSIHYLIESYPDTIKCKDCFLYLINDEIQNLQT